MIVPPRLRELRQLASLYGVQTAYYGADHWRHSALTESLVAALQGLGASVTSPLYAPAALREKRQQIRQRQLEPVTVAWDGNNIGLAARLPRSVAEASWECRLALESGEQHTWKCCGADPAILETADVEEITYAVKRIHFPTKLSAKLTGGYHQLAVEIPGLPLVQKLIISAPTKA